MNNKVRIGAGSKIFDRVLLVFELMIVLVLIVLSFMYQDAIYFLLVSIGVTIIQFITMGARNYVSFENGNFIIEGVFKRKEIISGDNFSDITEPPFGTTIPFSNNFMLNFKNGQRFRILGGASTKTEIEQQIVGLISVTSC